MCYVTIFSLGVFLWPDTPGVTLWMPENQRPKVQPSREDPPSGHVANRISWNYFLSISFLDRILTLSGGKIKSFLRHTWFVQISEH